MTTNPLEIRGLVKAFADVVAVDGVHLTLDADELLALVGPSGCGKSTLLRTIAGLFAADAGTIRLDGVLVEDGSVRLPPERRPAGLVFQEHALFPHLSVRDNVGFGLRDMSKKQVGRRVDEMLGLVSLAGYGDRYPHELSGGERQRVALARALAPEPALMLFDEPFASLDHNLRVQLRVDVAEVLKTTGTPAVFVTHDQHEALAIGDRIAVMRRGKVAQIGTAAEVFHAPVDRFVAAFMGEASFLPIADLGEGAATVLGPVDLEGHLPDGVSAMVRPDDVVFHADGVEQAEILRSEYHGTAWLATARICADDSLVHFLTSHLDKPEPGQRGSLELIPGHHQVIVPHEASA